MTNNIVLQVMILAVVQGLTEFLPISSSAHLILIPWLMGWQQLGMIFDVSLHVGTLLAILLYFRREWIVIAKELPGLLRGSLPPSRSRTMLLIAGTIPAGIFGFLARNIIEEHLRTPLVIAVCLIGFAILLWIAARIGKRTRSMEDAGTVDGVWIGTFQMLALIPGVSRSGVTITGALLSGFRSLDAARISFLLAAPTIAGAGLIEGREAYREYLKGPLSGDPLMRQSNPIALLLLGVLVSAVAGFFCIRYFLRYLQSGTLFPFVIYRILLGIVIVAVMIYGNRALAVSSFRFP